MIIELCPTVCHIFLQIFARVGVKQLNALAMAGSVAEEVLSSIKTVKAFSGHNKEVERFILICLQVYSI